MNVCVPGIFVRMAAGETIKWDREGCACVHVCVSGTLFKLGLIGLLMQMLSRLQLTVVRSALSSIFQKAIVDGRGSGGDFLSSP